MLKTVIGMSVLMMLSSASNAGIFGPSNYDECVLDSMKGVTSDTAANLIARSCRQKFPLKAVNKNARELKPWEVSALDGRGGISSSNFFLIDLYNGNKDITISEVSILIETKISGQSKGTVYTAQVNIPPQKTVAVGFSIITGDKGASYQWVPQSAKGY